MGQVLSGILAVAVVASVAVAQGGRGAAAAPPAEVSGAVTGGGIFAPGWQGKIDANEVRAGLKVESAKLSVAGNVFTVSTGPAITYWNPANTATGDYTVKATFREPKFMMSSMGAAGHPHAYGLVIAGNDMGTDNNSYLYCSVYGTNNAFIVRGMGPAPFQASTRLGVSATPAPGARGGRAFAADTNLAVNKAAAAGEPVQNEVALSVKGGKIECSINGKLVASFDKTALVGEGKLKSTDGVYGLRFAHNTEATVTGLTITKP
jgi:hypothetical protein